MKKATLIFAVILLAVGMSAYGVDLQSYGFTVTNTSQENGQTVYTISGSSGGSFTVSSPNTLTAANAKVLQSVESTFDGFKLLKIAQQKVVFNGDRADILIVPASFVYKGEDLSKYMPSGIQFYFDKYLQYDFRMFKDSLFLRLKGEFYDETQFADRLYNALQNPVLYLQTNNPEYLLQQIKDLVSKVDSLGGHLAQSQAQSAASDTKLSNAIDRLAQQVQEFRVQQQQFNQKQDAFNKQQAEYNQQQRDYNQQQAEYNKQQEAFNQRQEAFNQKQENFNKGQNAVNANVEKQLSIINDKASSLTDQFNNVRYSLLALNNRGFFGKVYPIDRKNIERVLAMKKADPSLTVDQVVAKLKADGVKMSKKEVTLVFEVYFNEFKS